MRQLFEEIYWICKLNKMQKYDNYIICGVNLYLIASSINKTTKDKQLQESYLVNIGMRLSLLDKVANTRFLLSSASTLEYIYHYLPVLPYKLFPKRKVTSYPLVVIGKTFLNNL
jgi:hypothetical protein